MEQEERERTVDGDFHFEPPNRRPVWTSLALTMSQAAALTGASERQIQHWMDRGYIHPASKGTRKISGESLDLILLIKQARAAGIPLRQAVPMAREYLNAEPSGSVDESISPTLLKEIHDRVAMLRDGLDTIEDMISLAQAKRRARRTT
jgi:DNA-binding transcriptional MerR regulator